MIEYVRLGDVHNAIRHGNNLPPSTRGCTLQSVLDEVDKLPRQVVNGGIDLTTVLSFEEGQRSAIKSLQMDLVDIKNHGDGNRYDYAEITKLVDRLLEKLK
jgi:hypothetical protein